MRKITKRSAAVIAGSALALTGGTAAFAYASGWFSGTGSVKAQSSTIQIVTATVDTSATHLYPGKSVQVKGTVANPNDYPVQIDTIGISDLGSSVGACTREKSKVSFGAVPAGLRIPPGTYNDVVLGNLTMGEADPACAGATFNITATMTGQVAG